MIRHFLFLFWQKLCYESINFFDGCAVFEIFGTSRILNSRLHLPPYFDAGFPLTRPECFAIAVARYAKRVWTARLRALIAHVMEVSRPEKSIPTERINHLLSGAAVLE